MGALLSGQGGNGAEVDGTTIEGSGTVADPLVLADTAVAAGFYDGASVTVDAQGRLTLARTDLFVSVKSYGALGDYSVITATGTDDRASIISAIAAAKTLGCRLHFPSGRYKISQYLDIADALGLRITGDNATIHYPSDDVTVVADAIATTDGLARSAFFMRRCRNVTVEGVSFQGATSPSFDLVNLGIAIRQTKCQGTRIINCKGYDGNAFHQQDASIDTTSTGDSIAVSSGVVTLTDASALFLASHVGRAITINNSAVKANNGVRVITEYVSTTVIKYADLYAANDTSAFTWSIDDSDRDTIIDKCVIERMRAPTTLCSNSKVLNSIFRLPMTPDLSGIVSSFAFSTPTVTFSATNGTWGGEIVGRYILVSGSTSAGNDGLFLITAATKKSRYVPATLTYSNASGVAEAGAATGKWWIAGGEKSGIGNGATAIAYSAGTVTLTASAASFVTSDIGKVIRISGAVTNSGANNGAYIILTVPSSTTLTFANAAGVNETYAKVWSIDGWDAAGGSGAAFGSTAAIYIFAGSDINYGRENIEVAGCTFIGIRKYCVKVSGSGTPIRNVRVHNNTAIECGGFTSMGADDSQEHAIFNISNNTLTDCATGRPGWSESVGIFFLGCRGARVNHNTFLYTRPSIPAVDGRATVSGIFGVQASRYLTGISQPLEDFSAQGNKFVIDYESNRPGLTLAYGISVQGCGLRARYRTGGTLTISGTTMTLTDSSGVFSMDMVGSLIQIVNAPDAANNITTTVLTVGSSSTLTFANGAGVGGAVSAGTYKVKPATTKRSSTCVIRDTENNGAATVSVQTNKCIGPEISNTTWSNAQGWEEAGSVTPRFYGGRQIGRSASTAGLQVGADTSWPIVYDNTITENGESLNATQINSCDVGIGIGNFTALDHPLLGKRGRTRPTRGRSETVFAYGSGWVDGDPINVSGSVYTYKTTAPGAGQFNSQASLMALVGSGFVAEDYGTGLTGTPATGHIRIRRITASTSVGGYIDGIVATAVGVLNPTACVIPRNASGGGLAYLQAVGPATSATPATSPIADKTAVWSPLCGASNSPRLHGYNATGAEMLTGGRAKGTITCVAKASMADGDYITIGDGINVPVLYEFDTVPDGVTGGRTVVDISADTADQDVAARLVTAINATQLTLSAAAGTTVGTDDHIITVTHKWPGAGGNVTMTENVANAGFLVTGFVGGMTGYYEIKSAANSGVCAVFQHGPQNYVQDEEVCWEVD